MNLVSFITTLITATLSCANELFDTQQPQLCCAEENDYVSAYQPCLTNYNLSIDNMRPTRGHGLMQCTPPSQYLPFQPMPPNIFPSQTAMMKPLLSTNTNTNTNTNNKSEFIISMNSGDNMPMPFDNAMDFDFDPNHSFFCGLYNMTVMDEALNGNGFNTPINNCKCPHCPLTFQHKYNLTVHLKIPSTGNEITNCVGLSVPWSCGEYILSLTGYSLGAWAAAAVDDQSMLIIRIRNAGGGHNCFFGGFRLESGTKYYSDVCGTRKWCYYADIGTMDGQSTTAAVDLSLTQKGQIGSSYHHFYVYITPIGDIPCYEPTITLSYERIDYHGGQQLWDIYGPDNIEIMECGASVLAHCTGYEPCLSNYNFGIDAIEPNNATKLIHLDTWSIDRYCNDLSVNVPVTITCSVPTGYPSIDPTDQPTTSTPTASPTDTTPMPTQSLTPNVTDCGERKTCYAVAITPIPQVQTSINLLLKGSESFKQTIDTTAERNSDEAGTTVIVCVLIVCVVLILSGLIYMKQHCDIFTDFITKADNQLLNGNIHLINVNCNDNNEMESNDARYISPRTEELIQNIIRRKTTVTVSVTHSAMLRILERELSEHSVECLIYDGSKISEQQNAILDHFRTDPDHMSPVLLMSEKLCHSLPFMVSLTQTCSLTLCTWLDEALSRDEAIEREQQTMGKRCVPRKGEYFQNHWNRRYISRFKEIRYCVWMQRLEKTFSALRQRDCNVNSNNVRSEEVTGICMDGHESIRVLNRDKNEQSVAKMLNLGLRQGNVVPTDHVRGMSVELFPHQKKGVAWMLQMEMDRLCKGGVLCDQMGVGKTIQIITLMLENREDARDEAKEKYKSEGYVSESDYCDSVVCNDDTCGGFVVRDDENVFRSDNGESEESDTDWSPDMGSNSDKKSKKKIQRGKTRKYCDLESDTEKTVSECDETVEIDKDSGLCMDCTQVLVQYKDKLMTIDVQPNDTVKQLKLRIKDREGIHVKDQTLNHGNQQLKDETDCSDITANGDIHLCLNLGLGGGRRIDITIVTNKHSFLLKVDQTCSILELKQHIQSKTGTAPQNQSLLGNGSKRLLEDRRTLDSYGIHADDIIQLTVLNRNNIIAIDDTDEDCDITEIAMNDPKPLKSPSTWVCNICTLENKPLSNLCAMCRTAKAGSTATKMSDEMLARELQKSFNAPSQSHTPNAPMLESSPDLGTQSHKREMRLDSTDTSLFSTLLRNAQIGPFGVITRLDQANRRMYYMPDTNNRNVLKWGYRPPTTAQTWVRERFGDLIDTLPRMNKAQRKQMKQMNGNGHYYGHEKYTFNDSNDTIDLSNDNSMNDVWQSGDKSNANVTQKHESLPRKTRKSKRKKHTINRKIPQYINSVWKNYFESMPSSKTGCVAQLAHCTQCKKERKVMVPKAQIMKCNLLNYKCDNCDAPSVDIHDGTHPAIDIVTTALQRRLSKMPKIYANKIKKQSKKYKRSKCSKEGVLTQRDGRKTVLRTKSIDKVTMRGTMLFIYPGSKYHAHQEVTFVAIGTGKDGSVYLEGAAHSLTTMAYKCRGCFDYVTMVPETDCTNCKCNDNFVEICPVVCESVKVELTRPDGTTFKEYTFRNTEINLFTPADLNKDIDPKLGTDICLLRVRNPDLANIIRVDCDNIRLMDINKIHLPSYNISISGYARKTKIERLRTLLRMESNGDCIKLKTDETKFPHLLQNGVHTSGGQSGAGIGVVLGDQTWIIGIHVAFDSDHNINIGTPHTRHILRFFKEFMDGEWKRECSMDDGWFCIEESKLKFVQCSAVERLLQTFTQIHISNDEESDSSECEIDEGSEEDSEVESVHSIGLSSDSSFGRKRRMLHHQAPSNKKMRISPATHNNSHSKMSHINSDRMDMDLDMDLDMDMGTEDITVPNQNNQRNYGQTSNYFGMKQRPHKLTPNSSAKPTMKPREPLKNEPMQRGRINEISAEPSTAHNKPKRKRVKGKVPKHLSDFPCPAPDSECLKGFRSRSALVIHLGKKHKGQGYEPPPAKTRGNKKGQKRKKTYAPRTSKKK